MSAPRLLQQVCREHIEHFGEPTDSIVFDDGKPIEGFPNRIDVFMWDADTKCDMTTFATIGMAAEPLPKAKHRAELHFAVRRSLTKKDAYAVARFLANLAMYPFQTGEPLDWWHTLSHPGDIPLFQTAQCVLLHPRFVENGWDSISTDGGEVHILNVIPITREVKDLRNVSAILDRLAEVDMFEPR
jgi:Suppressor of fused protein (SUFU)